MLYPARVSIDIPDHEIVIVFLTPRLIFDTWYLLRYLLQWFSFVRWCNNIPRWKIQIFFCVFDNYFGSLLATCWHPAPLPLTMFHSDHNMNYIILWSDIMSLSLTLVTMMATVSCHKWQWHIYVKNNLVKSDDWKLRFQNMKHVKCEDPSSNETPKYIISIIKYCH